MANFSSEEINELRRLSPEGELDTWLKAYECLKDGMRGEDSLKEINKDLPEDKQLSKTDYEGMLRGFREKSAVLRAGREGKGSLLLKKYKGKLNDLIDGINTDKIKKANLKDIGITMGIIDDKVTRREGKPTTKVAIEGTIKKEINNKITLEVEGLRSDLKFLGQFAKEHGINLPSEKEAIAKMKANGEIIEAEAVSVGAEDEDSEE